MAAHERDGYLLAAVDEVTWAGFVAELGASELSPTMGRTMQSPSEVGPGRHDWWPSGDGRTS